MALPTGFEPYCTSHRRYLWRLACRRAEDGDDGAAAVFRALRLEAVGTPLFQRLPGRAALLAAGVLAVEEVLGAGPDELVSYGLSRATAEALITALERIAATMTVFQSGPNAGQIYEQDDVTLLASATKTASYTTDPYEIGDKTSLRLDLAVTAASGTAPLLHAQVVTCKTSGGTYRAVDAFLATSTTGTERRVFAGLDRFVKVVATIAGTNPSFTHSISGEAL